MPHRRRSAAQTGRPAVAVVRRLASSGLALALAWAAGGCAHAPQCRCPPVEPAATASPAPRRAPGPPAPQRLQPTPAPEPAPAAPPAPREVIRVRLAAVGDVIPHGDVLRAAAAADRRDAQGRSLNNAGFDALLAGVRPALADADLTFANLETPVAPASGSRTIPFRFNAPPALLAALWHLGVRLVSVANNHIYDQQRAGLVESLRRLDRSGLVYAGAGRTCERAYAARHFELQGIRFALLAASGLYNRDLNAAADAPCAAELDERRLLAGVRRARLAGAELVLLSLHWGDEYHTRPSAAQIALAHRLLDGGVDVLLGHHPHVLQPVEVYRAADGRICLVAYSLGNFLSNQSRFYVHGLQPEKMGHPRDGVVLRFSAVRKDYGEGPGPVELADLSLQPLWTQNNALERRRQAKLPVIIRVLVSDFERAALEGRLAEAKRPAERRALLRRIALLRDRRRIAGAILGADLLAEPLPAGGP